MEPSTSTNQPATTSSQAQTAVQRRKSIDCRKYPSTVNCSLKISGTESEVLSIAVEHAVRVHGHEDGPELVRNLRGAMVDERE